jgi:hypothetical protein
MKGNFKSLRFNMYFQQEQQSITSPTRRRQFVVYVGRLPQKSTKFQVILIKKCYNNIAYILSSYGEITLDGANLMKIADCVTSGSW